MAGCEGGKYEGFRMPWLAIKGLSIGGGGRWLSGNKGAMCGEFGRQH